MFICVFVKFYLFLKLQFLKFCALYCVSDFGLQCNKHNSYWTISGYSHCPRVVVRTSGNDIARAGGEGNISFKVRITTQGQSVYPDISLHISNYCVYCIEDQNRPTYEYIYVKNEKKKKKELELQLTLVISNSMGPWKKFESTVVRLKRSYEDTGSVDCLTTKGRQL
jgi:hypothetical protein